MAAPQAVKAAKEIYRGYMPPNLPQHRPPVWPKPWWKVVGRPRVTLYPKEEPPEWTEHPEYAPLNDGTRKGLKTQVRLDWYAKIQSLPTIEEKLHEINRHGKHYIAHINNWLQTCSSSPMSKYLTQTHLINSLPESYNVTKAPGSESQDNIHSFEDNLQSRVRQILLDQIALSKYECTPKKRHNSIFISRSIRDGNKHPYISNSIIQNLVDQVTKAIAASVNPQLLNYQRDLSPAIRSWLYHSGVEPPNNKLYYKSRKDEDGNINQIIQIDGSSALNFRAQHFIEPVIDMDDPIVTDRSLVEKCQYPLKYFGAKYKFKCPVSLPGFWYQDQSGYDFPHTCFLSTDCLQTRNSTYENYAVPLNDDEDCLNSQAILTAFSWLNGLAAYHGFTPFQELEYPFTCQLITTDGQTWMFHVYQLNSHTFHRDLGGPSRNNICWSSGKMQLYETYENGQFKGINEDVIGLIIRFMSQQTSPSYTEQLNLKPHLGEDNRAEEDQKQQQRELCDSFIGRTNKFLLHDWNVPLWEHIFFRSKIMRGKITHMKPKWHIPKPPISKNFE